jgi:nitrate reductase NapE component
MIEMVPYGIIPILNAAISSAMQGFVDWMYEMDAQLKNLEERSLFDKGCHLC